MKGGGLEHRRRHSLFLDGQFLLHRSFDRIADGRGESTDVVIVVVVVDNEVDDVNEAAVAVPSAKALLFPRPRRCSLEAEK